MIKSSSKDRLIEATIEAIYLNGLHSVTTSKIAKQAKLSEAMIYKHFGNKDEMIVISFMNIKLRLNNYIESKIENIMDLNTVTYNVWLAHVDFFINNPTNLRVLNQFEHSNYMTDKISEECLKFSSVIISIFESGIKQGIYKEMHIEVAIALFFSPILSIADSIINKRIIKTEAMLKLLYDSTMLSLKV